MKTSWREWPAEIRTLPENQREAARHNAGGAVAEIDLSMLPDSKAWAPPESYRGVFEIDESGVPTGRYFRNPDYGPVKDDYAPFASREPQPWFPDDEPAAMKEALASALADQSPGAIIEWVKFRGKVQSIVGGPREPGNSDCMVVRRSGMAVEFVCSVVSSGAREFLHGVVTVSSTGLDKPGAAHSRIWVDIASELPVAEALEKLDARVFQVDSAEYPEPHSRRKRWRR